ncbi:CheR family methyltransferase [Maioricimonas rarisocia]|nr:protein-glutamate O-methyltransferase CheR [Maioricimonas rarisocia]
MTELLQFLSRKTGLTFSTSRSDIARDGVMRAMAAAGTSCLADYRAWLESDAAVFDSLVSELTVGETYFFRDHDQFDYLRREVLPAICRELGSDHVIRMWSAACASGEEPYSLAMLLDEEGLAQRSHVLGTDVSRDALAKAEAGIYRQWSLRGSAGDAARRYLDRRGTGYRLRNDIRDRVVLQYLNLADDSYPSFATHTWGLDVILCRNVLIYFDEQTVARVGRQLYESLRPGGWLLIGASDPPLRECAPFVVETADCGLIYRRPSLPAIGNPSDDVRTAPGRSTSLRRSASRVSSSGSRPESISTSRGESGRAASGSERRSGPADNAAQRAFRDGEYARAERLLSQSLDEADQCALYVRSVACRDSGDAARLCAECLSRNPTSTELHFLHAALLMELEQNLEAAEAARRVLFLDRTLAAAHFMLGAILRRLGDDSGAARAFRNASRICRARPPAEVQPLSDGERADRLAQAAEQNLRLLHPSSE